MTIVVALYHNLSQTTTMNIHIKNAEELEKMRVAGRLAADVLEMITPHVLPGVTTNELNDHLPSLYH